MSAEDKNFQETIKEAVAETQETANTATAVETDESISNDNSEETNSGETPEYVKGIDISDVPEQDRPRVKEAIDEKLGLLEKGYQDKFQEVAKFKKAQEELIEAGLSVEESHDVLLKHLEQKRNPVTTTEKKKDAVKLLDTLLENAPYEQKQSLEQMRQIILEETNVSTLQKEVADLKAILQQVQGTTIETQRTKINSDLDAMIPKYGKDFVDKYRDIVTKKSLQNPKVPIRKILKFEADDDEFEQAILAAKKEKSNIETKKNAISSKGSGITGAKEMIDTKQSWKGLIKDLGKK